MKSFVSKEVGTRCDTEATAAAIEEMNRYCEAHPGGPVAVRRPQLLINFVVLLGEAEQKGL
jgi:hypothetical protein